MHMQPAALIGRLSDDILDDIFHLLASSSFFHGNWGREEGPSLVIAQVCRYWRLLALDSPRIWSYIRLSERSHTSMLREVLARSEDLPLHVNFERSLWHMPSSNVREIAKLLNSQAHRILELQMHGLASRDMETFLNPLNSPAPMLQALRLRLTPSMHMLSEPVFGGQIPSLRILSTIGVSALWAPGRNLTELTLAGQPAPPLEELTSFLRLCPDLQVLRLELSEATSTAAQIHEQTSISMVDLARLRRLTLGSDSALHVICLLGRISFPTTTTVNLHLQGTDHHGLSVARDCPSLHAIISNIRSLTLSFYSKVYHGCGIILMSDSRLSIHWGGYGEGVDLLARTGVSALAFPMLEHLIIDGVCESEEDQLLQLFRSMPALTTLQHQSQIVRPAQRRLFQALARNSVSVTTASHIDSVVCPNLKTFVAPHGVDREACRQIVECFSTRAAAGARLSHVTLSIVPEQDSGYPDFSLLHPLREAVDEVTVLPGIDTPSSG